MQADQLQLELQHLEKKHGQDLLEPAPSAVRAEGPGMPLLPPPPPRVPDLGPYGKGKPAEEGEQAKGKSSPSAQWIAGQSGAKVPTGWKNYMVPLTFMVHVEPCGLHVLFMFCLCVMYLANLRAASLRLTSSRIGNKIGDALSRLYLVVPEPIDLDGFLTTNQICVDPFSVRIKLGTLPMILRFWPPLAH